MSLKDDIDVVVKKIRSGISRHGCHVLHSEELEVFWSGDIQSDYDKRLRVENFAEHYGFLLHLSPHLMIAVFRDMESMPVEPE